MEYRSDIHGYDPGSLVKRPEEAVSRLKAIFADKVLRFNPYSVSDEELLACVERAVWRPWPALTQMVVFHFHDIRSVQWKHPYDAIFFHIGHDSAERHLPLGSLTRSMTYLANLSHVHVEVNGRPLTNRKMVERMQGKDYFISHALTARSAGLKIRPVYRMFTLRGDGCRRADLIRQKMIESKLFMLQEIIAHPYSPQYLQCSRNFIDYATPIAAAIAAINRFPHYCPINDR